MDSYPCPVCGYTDPDGVLPWGENGMSPSHDFCDCCGVEWGYEASDYESMKQYRLRWLRGGARWNRPTRKPDGWNVAEQLDNVSPDEESWRLAVALIRSHFGEH